MLEFLRGVTFPAADIRSSSASPGNKLMLSDTSPHTSLGRGASETDAASN